MLLLPIYSTAIKGWSKVNYHLSSIYDCPYLSCNDHCDWRLFQEIAIVISKKFFWTILSLFFFWNLNTFTKHKEQICLLFHFLMVVSKSFCVLIFSTFSYFSTVCKHTGWVLFLLVVLQSPYVIKLSIFVLGQVH